MNKKCPNCDQDLKLIPDDYFISYWICPPCIQLGIEVSIDKDDENIVSITLNKFIFFVDYLLIDYLDQDLKIYYWKMQDSKGKKISYGEGTLSLKEGLVLLKKVIKIKSFL